EDFSGVGVDDGGVVVVDEADDLCAGVGPADAEVEHASAVSQADLAGGGCDVVLHSPVGRVIRWGRRGFGDQVVGVSGGAAVDAAVRTVVFVVVAEVIEDFLQLGDGGGVLGA